MKNQIIPASLFVLLLGSSTALAQTLPSSSHWRRHAPVSVETYTLNEAMTIGDLRDQNRSLPHQCIPRVKDSSGVSDAGEWRGRNYPTHFEIRTRIDFSTTQNSAEYDGYNSGHTLFRIVREHYALRHGVRQLLEQEIPRTCMGETVRHEFVATLPDGQRLRTNAEISEQLRHLALTSQLGIDENEPRTWGEHLSAHHWLTLFDNTVSRLRYHVSEVRLPRECHRNRITCIDAFNPRAPREHTLSSATELINGRINERQSQLHSLSERVLSEEGQCNLAAFEEFLRVFDETNRNVSHPLSLGYNEWLMNEIGLHTPQERAFANIFAYPIQRAQESMHQYASLLELTFRPACETGAPPSQLEFETPEAPAAQPRAPQTRRNRRGNIR